MISALEKTQVDYDVIVVGAGFAGIYAIWKAKQSGFTVRGFEAAPEVGGTWYWNSYPGARCDVSTYSYAYFFDPEIVREWDWSNVCADQTEILRYLRFAADKCQVNESITFNTKIRAAKYLEAEGLWRVTTWSGEQYVARYVIMAIGALSTPKTPDIPGATDFAGLKLFTSDWPKDQKIDLTGLSVGVIGTGSSGVQVIPEVAKVARTVHVFQRTANFVIPSEAGPVNPEQVSLLRAEPAQVRKDLRATFGGNQVFGIGEHRFSELDEQGRQDALQRAWDGKYIALAFRDAHLIEANAAISEFIRQKMAAVVADPWTAKQLVPWDHPYGGKRPCRSDQYLQAFNSPHVRLLSLKETPIVKIEADGIQTTTEKFELDAIIYATGFDAITGAVFALDIEGLGDKKIREAWKDGPANYLGTMVHGFPNVFFPSSAMSPSVLSNMATLAEQQIDFIVDSMLWLDAHDRCRLHPKAEAQEFWQKEVLRYAHRRPGALTTNSWYNGANLPNKPRVFMIYCGGFNKYHELCLSELRNDFPNYELLQTPEFSLQAD